MNKKYLKKAEFLKSMFTEKPIEIKKVQLLKNSCTFSFAQSKIPSYQGVFVRWSIRLSRVINFNEKLFYIRLSYVFIDELK